MAQLQVATSRQLRVGSQKTAQRDTLSRSQALSFKQKQEREQVFVDNGIASNFNPDADSDTNDNDGELPAGDEDDAGSAYRGGRIVVGTDAPFVSCQWEIVIVVDGGDGHLVRCQVTENLADIRKTDGKYVASARVNGKDCFPGEAYHLCCQIAKCLESKFKNSISSPMAFLRELKNKIERSGRQTMQSKFNKMVWGDGDVTTFSEWMSKNKERIAIVWPEYAVVLSDVFE